MTCHKTINSGGRVPVSASTGGKFAPSYDFFTDHYKVEEVKGPVKDVRVCGFEVSGFNGQNVVVYGGKNTKISYNKLKAGGRYGFLTIGSTGTEASNNISSSPATLKQGSIAVSMDDFSSAVSSYNDISYCYIRLWTETSGGIKKDYHVNKNPDISDNSTGKNEIRDNKCDLTFRGPLPAIIPVPEYCR